MTRTAILYDAVHEAEGKDYAREAGAIVNLVRARHPDASSLLDVGCGTGRHLEHLARHFRCVGLDLDEGMLEMARSRCPSVALRQGDMTEFELDERFDVVTCLFSAIGYALTPERLGQAVTSMARHLEPGGLLVVEPWFQPEQWIEGFLSVTTIDRPSLKAARVSRSQRRGAIAVMDFHYVVGTGEGVESFVEHHELALFTWDQYHRAFEIARLAAEMDRVGLTGRGLLIGRKDA